MSMGKWNEDAQFDEIGAIRSALEAARNARLESIAAKLPELAALAVTKSDKVRKSTGNGGRRAKGEKSSVTMSKYPFRDETAGRNFRVVEWTPDKRVIEYSPVRRYKVDDIGVEPEMNLSYEEYPEMDPEWIVTTFYDNMDEVYDIL